MSEKNKSEKEHIIEIKNELLDEEKLDEKDNIKNDLKSEKIKKIINNEDNKNKKGLENIEYTKIVGNYLLFDQIGMGSFSKVTKAIHLITEQIVAVKILEKEKIEDEIDVERIIREIEILKAIMHPNIAQMYETYSTVHNIYLMMEYIEGGDLFDYITNNSFLPEPIACNIYRQIISVLEYLNQMGISHRDIKPENILLDKEHKNIKFIDFGLSNYCKDKELLQSSCGSPCYASPEMLSGKPYRGVTTDLWSSGIVLYSMLVGSLPFDDQEIQKLYEQIKLGKFYLPSTLSLEAIDLLKKLLEVNPKKRITLKQIKEHPWFSLAQNPLYKGIIYNYDNDNNFPYDNKVISYVINEYYKDDKKINKDKLIEMIQKHESNQYTATYYLTKKYVLKIEDNDFEIYMKKENNNKIILKLETNENFNNENNENKNIKTLQEKEKDLSKIDKDAFTDRLNKRCNTQENMTKNLNKNQEKDNKEKFVIHTCNNNKENNMDKNKENNNKINKIRDGLINTKNEIPKLDLRNINLIPINQNNNSNNKPLTTRGISPPNDLNTIFSNNNNNPINILKTEENENLFQFKNMNLYKDNKNKIRKEILNLDNKILYYTNRNNSKDKKRDVIPSLSKTHENIHSERGKFNQTKSNRPVINEDLKTENNIVIRKKANSHRKKFFNMIPKLNISNTINGNNYKKHMNSHTLNYSNNKDNYINLNNNNFKVKNNYNSFNYNNIINKDKNSIYSYLNTDVSKYKEKGARRRNLSKNITNQIKNYKTCDSRNNNNNILFANKLGLLSKINLKNNLNNNIITLNINNNNYNSELKNLSRNSKIDEIYMTKTLEKNNYLISQRNLEQKNANNRIRNNGNIKNYKGVLNLKATEKNKKWKLNNEGNNLNLKTNDTNFSNNSNNFRNNNFGINQNFINKCYMNNGNIINNNNNIILNIQNYYNKKNTKKFDSNSINKVILNKK